MTTPEQAGRGGRVSQRPSLDNFASVIGLSNGEHEVEYDRRWLPFDSINVLPQGRKTFDEEGLRVLADDIADKKLINLPLIATFDKEGADKYLAVINELWGADFESDSLMRHQEEDGSESFNVLIAGERRFRACKMLLADGRYQKKFKRDDIFVTYALNIPPMEAIFRQASENTYMSVPPHEEAVYYSEMFRVIKIADPEYPLTRFARNVGRSSEKVRDALKFCLLPETIQGYVREGALSYGTACEIARLAQRQVGEDDINFFTKRALTGKYRVDDFKQLIDEYFAHKDSGQSSMFDVFTQEQEEEMRKAGIKKTVQKEFIFGLWSFIYYFAHVTKLFEDGKLGQDESPFSTGSPVRIFSRLVEAQTSLLPHFKGIISSRQLENADSAISALRDITNELGMVVPDDDFGDVTLTQGKPVELGNN